MNCFHLSENFAEVESLFHLKILSLKHLKILSLKQLTIIFSYNIIIFARGEK